MMAKKRINALDEECVSEDVHVLNLSFIPNIASGDFEIYEMAQCDQPCEYGDMGDAQDKKLAAQDLALALAKKLTTFMPEDMNERQWCKAAKLSGSFFSNMRGTPTHPPSVPSIANLMALLRAANVTLSEFFLDESKGRVIRQPSAHDLEQVIRDALPGLPQSPDMRVQYLAAIVSDVLALPRSLPVYPANQDTAPDDEDDQAQSPTT